MMHRWKRQHTKPNYGLVDLRDCEELAAKSIATCLRVGATGESLMLGIVEGDNTTSGRRLAVVEE